MVRTYTKGGYQVTNPERLFQSHSIAVQYVEVVSEALSDWLGSMQEINIILIYYYQFKMVRCVDAPKISG